MERDIADLLFEVRYAVRVLEREARLWNRIDIGTKLFSFLATTAAFGAIIKSRPILTIFFGLLLAVLQAIQFVLNPPSRALEARQAGQLYQKILASDARRDPAKLEQALLDARSQDPVSVLEALRVCAYNDVARERGLDQGVIPPSHWQRLVNFFA